MFKEKYEGPIEPIDKAIKKIMEKLQEKGFKATRSHCKATGIKTNAPIIELKKSIKSIHNLTCHGCNNIVGPPHF